MNKQTLFDKALFGIRKQKTFSGGMGGCLYNGPFNTHCVIGHCIDDNGLREWMDHNLGGIGRINTETPPEQVDRINQIRRALEIEEDDDDGIEFLVSLQNIHDNAAHRLFAGSAALNELLDLFEDKMQALAISNGLVYTPRDKE